MRAFGLHPPNLDVSDDDRGRRGDGSRRQFAAIDGGYSEVFALYETQERGGRGVATPAQRDEVWLHNRDALDAWRDAGCVEVRPRPLVLRWEVLRGYVTRSQAEAIRRRVVRLLMDRWLSPQGQSSNMASVQRKRGPRLVGLPLQASGRTVTPAIRKRYPLWASYMEAPDAQAV